MYIVIVGGGKLGAYLAGTLLREGNQVALIEKCDAQARRLLRTSMVRAWLSAATAARLPSRKMR